MLHLFAVFARRAPRKPTRMNKRTLRSAVTLVIAGLSASIEAPRLVQHPLRATVELADVPTAIGNAVEHAASTVAASHLGFDTNIYPGDKAMTAWKQSGEYEWVGYYLKAPCHSDNSWLGTRERLGEPRLGPCGDLRRPANVGKEAHARERSQTIGLTLDGQAVEGFEELA